MNYRAIEDLINILVKKAGYNLGDTTTLEDTDILTKRRGILEDRIEKLNAHIKKEEYVDKEDKARDLEEKKYLEDTLDIIKNQQEEGSLTLKEVSSLEEQIKVITAKIDSKEYTNIDRKTQDLEELDALNNELYYLSDSIEKKRNTPSELGAIILEAYRENKSFNDIKDELKLLVEKATNSYNKTVNEIKTSNIFQLMDEYNNKKSIIFKKLEENVYDNKSIKSSIKKKCEYHNGRINAYKETMVAIEKREDELETLIENSKDLYIKTLNERLDKENELEEYTKKIYELNNLDIYKNDFNSFLDYLKEDIENDKLLENKYNEDVLNYKNEIRTLEINNKKVNASIMNEERYLDILNKKLELFELNNKDRVEDEVSYLDYSKRLANLANEQQYYYVNIEVIENEIVKFWNKENSYEVTDIDASDNVESTMYEDEDEDVLDYTDDVETEDIALEPLEEDEEVNLKKQEESDTKETSETEKENFELLDDFE